MSEESGNIAGISEQLITTDKGAVKQCIRNVVTVLESDPKFMGAIRYNMMTDRNDIVKDLGWYRESPALTDSDIDHIMLYLEEHYSLTTEKKIKSAINVVAMENKYHPIRKKLCTLVWDGEERIKYVLHHFLGADQNNYVYEAMRVLLLGAISRVFCPGTKFEYMLILVGGQGAGKSTFFRFLAMNDSWFTDDLKKLDDENVFRKMQGHLIIELSEMIATASARSIEDIKSFISRQSDIYKACLVALPTLWTRFRLIEQVTDVSCRSWFILAGQSVIFLKMKSFQENISNRCGRKQWRYTSQERSGLC